MNETKNPNQTPLDAEISHVEDTIAAKEAWGGDTTDERARLQNLYSQR